MFDYERLEELKRDYKAGKSMEILSGLYDISRQTITAIMKREGEEGRRGVREGGCPACGKVFKLPRLSKKRFCSQRCYIWGLLKNAYSPYNNGNKKLVIGHGYRGIHITKTIRSFQRNAVEVVKGVTGLYQKGMVVHHLDGDVTNNEKGNLYVFLNQSKHLAYHHRLRKDRRCLPISTDGFYLKNIS